MLEVINALKNNNMRKVPQYDPSLIEEARKTLRAISRGRGKGFSSEDFITVHN